MTKVMFIQSIHHFLGIEALILLYKGYSMAAALYNQYINRPMIELVKKLDKDYYEVLKLLCNNATAYAEKLRDAQEYHEMALYVSLSLKMFEEVKSVIVLRNSVIIPYISDLDIKNKENHDCRNCSGNCHVGHQMYLTQLKDSHKKLKEILFRLQMVALPLYEKTDYPQEYKVLRNEITVIDTVLTELFYLEESTLVPKMLEAQNRIHA